jgi:subfamily B ATP-binding cassette protein MsbA
MSTAIENKKKKRISPAAAWRDARELIWSHRYRLMLGMFLMIVNRLAGLVLPTSSKYVIDEVIVKHRSQLLMPLAIAAAAATLIQALSSFTLSQGIRCRRAARHNGHAQERAGTRRALAD